VLSAGSAWAAVPAWTTYHHDGARSGTDPDSTSPVAPSQLWQTPALDGSIWGEPLVYGSRVYVATENDTVYALDAASGAIVWQAHLGTPVSDSVIPCTGDINPTVGITSTPVIDPATGRIYVVADTWDGSHAASVEHQLYALNLDDGGIAVGPVAVDPPASTHTDQLQRASLALDAGKVIIGYGGNDGDCGNYHGWLVAVPETGGLLQSFEVDGQPGDSQGAIWGSGNAPAIDGAGDVWVSTGNGNSANFDFSESVIKLDSNLNVVDWWAPTNWQSLDSLDLDLGSTMPLLLPGGLVFQIGKEGVGYLLSQSSLGRAVGSAVYQATVCPSGGDWGGGIYSGGVIYVTCLTGTATGIHALALNTASRTFAPLPGWTTTANAIGPPIEAGGLIWSTDWSSGNLYGLNPTTGTTSFSTNLNGFEHFATPSAAGGRLFVANRDAAAAGDDVTAFTIANPPAPTPTTAGLSSSSNPSRTGVSVTFTAKVSPAPDGGTIAFTDDGAPIPGCSTGITPATAVASCTASFPSAGTDTIAAIYSGDAYYEASSASLSQVVGASAPPPGGLAPKISRLHVHVVHHRLRLSLLLSEPARVIVRISKLVPGRFVHGRCRIGAKHGRGCLKRMPAAPLWLSGRAGANSFRPPRLMSPGRYAVMVSAVDASGRRSLPHTIVVIVMLRRSR
jgi:outer membrane protein assembly factor BamB